MVPVSSAEVAEAAKLFENTFRFINIGLVNEFAQIMGAMGIPADEVLDAATAAVEELATQVATLMAALKAQITTLANTVAKIAKKVKA